MPKIITQTERHFDFCLEYGDEKCPFHCASEVASPVMDGSGKTYQFEGKAKVVMVQNCVSPKWTKVYIKAPPINPEHDYTFVMDIVGWPDKMINENH